MLSNFFNKDFVNPVDYYEYLDTILVKTKYIKGHSSSHNSYVTTLTPHYNLFLFLSK